MACWVWFFSLTILLIESIKNSNADGNFLLTSKLNSQSFKLKCYAKSNLNDKALVWKFPNSGSYLHAMVKSRLNILPSTTIIVDLEARQNTRDYPHIEFGQTDDVRWNGLKSKNVTESDSFPVDVNYTKFYNKHFSILSRNSFDLLITNDKDETFRLQFGHDVNLTSEHLTLKSGYITLVTLNSSDQRNQYLSISATKPHARSGTEWVDMSISINEETHDVSVRFGKDSTSISFSIMSKAKKIEFKQPTSGAYYFVKVHDHAMTVLPEDGKGFETNINVDEGCIVVTYVSVHGKLTVAITGEKSQKKEADLKNTGGKWKVERITFPFKGTVQVRFIGKSHKDNIQAIGALRSCTRNEYFQLETEVNALPIDGTECGYKENKKDRVTIKNRSRNGRKIEAELDETLEGLIQEKEQFCDLSGCSCMGSSGDNCKDGCKLGSYGHDCKGKCDNCIGDRCRKTDGVCEIPTECQDYYRPPMCNKKLLASDVQLEKKNIGVSWVEVDITNAVADIDKKFLEIHRGKPKVKIGFLNLTATCASETKCKTEAQQWKTIPWKPNRLMQRLTGLKSGTKYTIRLLVAEQNTMSVNNNTPEIEFKTKNCSKDGKFDLHPSNTSLKITWEKGEFVCPPQDYEIQIEDMSNSSVKIENYGNTNIGQLTPYTKYRLKVISGNGKESVKNFSTTEGAPERVPPLKTHHTGSDLTVQWKKPTTINGILKGYTVELKHDYYVACGLNSADNQHSRVKTVDKSVESVSFNDMAIYSRYSIVVTASTNAMKGKGRSATLTTSMATSINEAPTLDSDNLEKGKYFLNITWNPPDCKTAGCEIDETYLIKINYANETLEKNETKYRFYKLTNLTKNTEYSVSIEARCKGTAWSGKKGVLAFKIKTNLFDAAEVAGITCGSIFILFLIAALVFVAVWRYKRNQIGYVPTGGKDYPEDDKMQLRYLPAPKKHGQLVRRENFASYVSKARANGSLKKDFELLPSGQQKPWLVGISNGNKHKNRYAKLLAYDHSRVALGDQGDYINANFISDDLNKKKYIASQGPMEKTTTDFWQMIWQEQVDTVVMLTKLVEKTVRCHKYWPDVGSSETFGEYLVQNVNEHAYADHVERTLSLTGRMGHREILQLHYTAWPHQGVPEDIDSFAKFMGKVLAREKFPLLIHCSGGTGRTGTVTLIDLCLRKYLRESMINVWAVAERMRHERVNMIENKAQYEFAHVLMSHYLSHYG